VWKVLVHDALHVAGAHAHPTPPLTALVQPPVNRLLQKAAGRFSLGIDGVC